MGCSQGYPAAPTSRTAASQSAAAPVQAAVAEGEDGVHAPKGEVRYGGTSRPRLPPPQTLAGVWRSQTNGYDFTLAPRTRGLLHYNNASTSRVALLRPEGDAYVGDEIFFNLGVPRRVRLCPREDVLEWYSWNEPGQNWFAPNVLRRLSASESAQRGRYVGLAGVWEALAAQHTVLFKGSWMLEWYYNGVVLPRRQELPPGAAWDPSELQRRVEAGAVRIVALSYCWKTPEHPDPDGEQLHTVVELIERRLAYSFPDGTRVLEDLAIFWDYPNLFQKPRSNREQEAFDKGLMNVNLWYAHTATEAWLLTRVPSGSKPYNLRGWPTFERAVSGLITPQDSFLDVGLWEGGHEPWENLANMCRAQREPPLTPQRAGALLARKSFTNGADLAKVARIYERTYREVMGSARNLNFSSLPWGDREAEALAECLPDCPQLEELDLNYDLVGAAGAAALGAGVVHCRRLRVVHLASNPIGDEGVAALFTGLVRCPAVEVLLIRETGIGDVGAEAIAAALPRCRALRTLVMDGCDVSDAGAAALGAVLPQCAALQQLQIDRNPLITPSGEEALKEAWIRAGKLHAEHLQLGFEY